MEKFPLPEMFPCKRVDLLHLPALEILLWNSGLTYAEKNWGNQSEWKMV